MEDRFERRHAYHLLRVQRIGQWRLAAVEVRDITRIQEVSKGSGLDAEQLVEIRPCLSCLFARENVLGVEHKEPPGVHGRLNGPAVIGQYEHICKILLSPAFLILVVERKCIGRQHILQYPGITMGPSPEQFFSDDAHLAAQAAVIGTEQGVSARLRKETLRSQDFGQEVLEDDRLC